MERRNPLVEKLRENSFIHNTIVTENIVDLKNILSVTDIEEQHTDIYFNFVLEQGYLKITHLNKEEGKIIVKIPNKEIAKEFRIKLRLFFESPDFKLQSRINK